MDSDYNIDEYKLDEQLVDTDEKNQNSEQVIQKKMLENLNMDYKVYTSEFDEITKAENLENADEANKLRKAFLSLFASSAFSKFSALVISSNSDV